MRTWSFTNGWNLKHAMVRRGSAVIMLTLGLTAFAQETEAPSMELLEFLGESIRIEEEIVDPLALQAMEEMTDTKQDIRKTAHD